MAKLFASKGDIILTKTGEPAYQYTRDVYEGDPITADQLAGISRPDPQTNIRIDPDVFDHDNKRWYKILRQTVDTTEHTL